VAEDDHHSASLKAEARSDGVGITGSVGEQKPVALFRVGRHWRDDSTVSA